MATRGEARSPAAPLIRLRSDVWRALARFQENRVKVVLEEVDVEVGRRQEDD